MASFFSAFKCVHKTTLILLIFYIDWSHFPINILLVRTKETERSALYGN